MIPLTFFVSEINKIAARPVTYSRVRAAINAGTIPSVRAGTRYYVDAEHVEAAAALLEGSNYPKKANGARARAAAHWARRTASEARGV